MNFDDKRIVQVTAIFLLKVARQQKINRITICKVNRRRSNLDGAIRITNNEIIIYSLGSCEELSRTLTEKDHDIVVRVKQCADVFIHTNKSKRFDVFNEQKEIDERKEKLDITENWFSVISTKHKPKRTSHKKIDDNIDNGIDIGKLYENNTDILLNDPQIKFETKGLKLKTKTEKGDTPNGREKKE